MFPPTINDIGASLRERVAEIDAELSTFDALREERDRLTAAIAALENDAGSEREPAARRIEAASSRRRRPSPRGQTQTAVLAYLAEHPGSSAAAIAEALGLKRSSTSTRLTQMAKTGSIVRSEGRGFELANPSAESAAAGADTN